MLKIDRSFVAQLDQCPEGLQIVQTILSLARNLGIEAVAEGVETERHLAILKSLDCDFGQGYFFARPLSATALAGLLKEKSLLAGHDATVPGILSAPFR
ncbi:Phytochrome-like protein cph2 [compost metagenome]